MLVNLNLDQAPDRYSLSHLEQGKLQAKVALNLDREISKDEKAAIYKLVSELAPLEGQPELTAVVHILQPVK